MDAIQTTPSSISDPSYQKVIISLVQFEQDFNTRTKMFGYIRPDQFLDRLTVIKIGRILTLILQPTS